jgi:hypothetical protein
VGLYDAWLTKFDPQGQIVWAQQFGTTGYEFLWAVETDSQGNIYLTGITTGIFPGSQGGNVEGNITGSSDIFVAKYLPTVLSRGCASLAVTRMMESFWLGWRSTPKTGFS